MPIIIIAAQDEFDDEKDIVGLGDVPSPKPEPPALTEQEATEPIEAPPPQPPAGTMVGQAPAATEPVKAPGKPRSPTSKEKQAMNDLALRYAKDPTEDNLERILSTPLSDGKTLMDKMYYGGDASGDVDEDLDVGVLLGVIRSRAMRYDPSRGDFENYLMNAMKYESMGDDRTAVDKYIRAAIPSFGGKMEDQHMVPDFVSDLDNDYDKVRETYIWNEHEFGRSKEKPMSLGGSTPSRVEEATSYWTNVARKVSAGLKGNPRMVEVLKADNPPVAGKGELSFGYLLSDDPSRQIMYPPGPRGPHARSGGTNSRSWQYKYHSFDEMKGVFAAILREAEKEKVSGSPGEFSRLASEAGLDADMMFVRPDKPRPGDKDEETYPGKYYLTRQMIAPEKDRNILYSNIRDRSTEISKGGNVSMQAADDDERRFDVSEEEKRRGEEIQRGLGDVEPRIRRRTQPPAMPAFPGKEAADEAARLVESIQSHEAEKEKTRNERSKMPPGDAWGEKAARERELKDEIWRERRALEKLIDGRGPFSRFHGKDMSPRDVAQKMQDMGEKMSLLNRDRSGHSPGVDVLVDMARESDDMWGGRAARQPITSMKVDIAREYANGGKISDKTIGDIINKHRDAIDSFEPEPGEIVTAPVKNKKRKEVSVDETRQKFNLIAQSTILDLMLVLDGQFDAFKRNYEAAKSGKVPVPASRFLAKNRLVRLAIGGMATERALEDMFGDDMRSYVARLMLNGSSMDDVRDALRARFPKRLESMRNLSFSSMYADVKGKIDQYLGRASDAN